jgi:hypothetical protein
VDSLFRNVFHRPFSLTTVSLPVEQQPALLFRPARDSPPSARYTCGLPPKALTLNMETARRMPSSGMWRRVDLVCTKIYNVRRYIPENGILHSHCCEKPKSYMETAMFAETWPNFHPPTLGLLVYSMLVSPCLAWLLRDRIQYAGVSVSGLVANAAGYSMLVSPSGCYATGYSMLASPCLAWLLRDHNRVSAVEEQSSALHSPTNLIASMSVITHTDISAFFVVATLAKMRNPTVDVRQGSGFLGSRKVS